MRRNPFSSVIEILGGLVIIHVISYSGSIKGCLYVRLMIMV